MSKLIINEILHLIFQQNQGFALKRRTYFMNLLMQETLKVIDYLDHLDSLLDFEMDCSFNFNLR